MKLNSFLAVLIGSLIFSSNAMAENQIGSTKNEKIDEVSLVQLLSQPETYEGKFVRVEGFIRLEFEGNGIYLSRDDANYLIAKNSLWVEFDQNLWTDPANGKRIDIDKMFNGKFVLIEGIFDKNNKGHMGLFSGAIKKISRVMELKKYYS